MSKSKKASKVKPAKAAKVKKPVKKVNKPAAKKAPAKKQASKKPAKQAKIAPKASPKTKISAKKPSKPAVKAKVKPVTKAKAAPAPKKKPSPVSKPITIQKKQASAPKKPEPKNQSKAVITTKPVPSKSPAPKVEVEEKTRKADETPDKKGASDKKGSEVLAITNTIPIAQKNEISASRIASISNSITNPIKRLDSYSVRVEKEPAGKFELEFVIHASAEMLYEFLSTASGLSEWFCDDLNIRNGIYTFIWEDTMQQARLLKTIDLQLVRFQWVDKVDGSYFEFRIQRDDLTNDISLIVTDFGETHSERESAKLLWNSQIEKLMHVIGSIF